MSIRQVMRALEYPTWVQPFRFAAAVLGALLLVYWFTHLLMSPSLLPLSLRGIVITLALISFAAVPRRILARFWMLAALLACAALGFVLSAAIDMAAQGLDPVLLLGSALLPVIFAVMLIDAMLSRRAVR